jgi:hypothetical protein
LKGPGQSNSNLWFTTPEKPDQLGPNTAAGSIWINEKINAGEISEPFLFAGWPKRSAWIQNAGNTDVTFVFEVDKNGNQNWEALKTVAIRAGESANVEFSENETGEWIRVKPNQIP